MTSAPSPVAGGVETSPSRPVILVFVRFYRPGFRSGPTRSIANLVAELSGSFDFRIVALDRDVGESSAYPDIVADGIWREIEGAQVLHVAPGTPLRRIAQIMRNTHHDVLYLNSFFDPQFTLKPLLARRLGMAPKTPCILAPRGEFSPGALRLKAAKKRLFLGLVGPSGIFANLTWQATTDEERTDIASGFGRVARKIVVAPNLTRLPPEAVASASAPGAPLRVCFFSRISPKKQLPLALAMLRGVHAPVVFDIYGPVQDQAEWRRVEKAMEALPPHVEAHYRGSLDNDQVSTVLAGYDLFLLPTLGENFGHVIHEALAAGTPVLISDTTPWRGLSEAGVGWDLPLDDPKRFSRTIDVLAATAAEERTAMRLRARAFAAARQSDGDPAKLSQTMFHDVISHRR